MLYSVLQFHFYLYTHRENIEPLLHMLIVGATVAAVLLG